MTQKTAATPQEGLGARASVRWDPSLSRRRAVGCIASLQRVVFIYCSLQSLYFILFVLLRC